MLPGQDKPQSILKAALRRVRARRALCMGSAAIALTALALAACQKPAAQTGAAAPDPSGYLSPPTLVSATRDAAGGVVFSGRAPAEVEVRLRDPGGTAFSATANDDGDWSMQLPPSAAPRMFAFEGELSGRSLHGEGAILALPAPAPVAVLARAGYGALPIGEQAGPLRITAIDYDGAGGGSVSGVSAPGKPVRLVLDGQPAGVGQADRDGRFTVLDLNTRTPMRPGAHTVRIESPSGAVQGPLTVTPAGNLGGEAFLAVREGDGWRTDWRTPGGGTQTTVVFGAPSAGTKS